MLRETDASLNGKERLLFADIVARGERNKPLCGYLLYLAFCVSTLPANTRGINARLCHSPGVTS